MCVCGGALLRWWEGAVLIKHRAALKAGREHFTASWRPDGLALPPVVALALTAHGCHPLLPPSPNRCWRP